MLEEDAKRDGAQLIRRVANVLRYIASGSREGVSLRDVSHAMGLPRSTTHRILKSLSGKKRLALLDLEKSNAESVAGLGHSVDLSRLPRQASAIIGECTGGNPLEVADLLISAQLLGIAEATRDLAVSYAQVRHQFGRPIGAFQAIKHHCADMAIAAEMVSSLLDMAAIAQRDGREDAAFQIAALGMTAPKAALANARTCIQIHGGIGFSADADAHRYLKQAHVLGRLRGGSTISDLAAPLTPYDRHAHPPHR